MAVFDVRENDPNIVEIVFAEKYDGIACTLDTSNAFVHIRDNQYYLVIDSAEHARNLQKALDKAIELGWLK